MPREMLGIRPEPLALAFVLKLWLFYEEFGTTNGIPCNLHSRTQFGDNPTMDQSRCPFCHLEQSRIVLENEFAVAFLDAFPVADGHTLVVSKQHVASLFDLPDEELAAIWKLVVLVRGRLIAELNRDGFNVGVNDGLAAGQTVMHGHVHVIPRQLGDTADPRGGVRWIMPKKARFWDEGQR